MAEKKKIAEISQKITVNSLDFMSVFRHNVFQYLAENGLTLSNIAEAADIPFSTLRTFLYGDSQDAKLSNAIKLAKALNVSIDELTGAGTIPEDSIKSLAMCRNLPENDIYLIKWFIRYLNTLNNKITPNKRYISVMIPDINNNGDLKITSNYKKIEITDMDEPFKSKVFLGLQMNCDNYMPHYTPQDIILIANDRPPKPNENAVVRVKEFLFITKRKVENGVAKCYSIRDGKYWFDEKDTDELIGYAVPKKRLQSA